jgi:hypothetical protein
MANANTGWVKIYRELKAKSIWQLSSPEHKVVLITILTSVNHETNTWEWKGEQYNCLPGQMITSLPSLAKECGQGVTVQNVRTAIKRLVKLGFLTDLPTKSGRLITVVNWEKYQQSDPVTNSGANTVGNRQLTDTQQTANRQPTPIEEYKNNKNEKKNIKEKPAAPYSREELLELRERFDRYDCSEEFYGLRLEGQLAIRDMGSLPEGFETMREWDEHIGPTREKELKREKEIRERLKCGMNLM